MTASPLRNKRLLLVRRPKGLPTPEDFRLESSTPLSSVPPPGGVVLRTMYVSIDPAMRGWMSTAKSYLPPVALGTVMRASSVCRVLASDSAAFPVGSIVLSEATGVCTHAAVSGKGSRFLYLLPPPPAGLTPSAFLGVLGTTGLTAYFGLLRVGRPKPGGVVLVSGAAGATGSVVCQLARIHGAARVVGTAGSDDKCRWLEEHGIVDKAVNYRTHSGRKLPREIRAACGDQGADVVFDNVGSEFLDAALANLNRGARIVLCGAISQYNATNVVQGPKNYMNLLVKRATMQGFVVFDYRKDYDKAVQDLSGWIADGRLKHAEDVVQGIENFHPALLSLFNGGNKGKVVLKVDDQEEDDGGAISLPPSKL